MRDSDEIEQALAAGAPRLLLDNMDDDATARGGRPGGRPRAAGGQRRRDAADAQGEGADGGRMDLDGRVDAFRARPGSLPDHGGAAMNLPMAPTLPMAPSQAGGPALSPQEIADLQEEVRALAAERGAVILAHNYQLPEVQDVGRLRGRLAGPLARGSGGGRRDDRVLRRALHGRDRVDPVSGEDRADPRPGRRLLAGRVDRLRSAGRVEGDRTRRAWWSCT